MRTHLPVTIMMAFCAVATAATRIEVTQGVKKFASGDSIAITEVSSEKGTLAAGDTITVKGTYTLSSQKNARLLLSVTQDAAKNSPSEEQGTAQKTIEADAGKYEMTINISRDGWLHLGLYDPGTGKPFGQLYFGTKEQMDKIAHWNLEKWVVPKNGNEDFDIDSTNNWNFNQKYNEWKAMMEGKNGTSKDEAKAGQILTRLIKGIYLVKFGPADGFNPQTPAEYIPVFFQTSSLRSMGKDGKLGIGFLRTKRENNKLTASFLTNQPDQMKKDIEKNLKLMFVSMEEMTPDKFISYDKSVQESLQTTPSFTSFHRSVTTERYMSCENHVGAGFYWVDTTVGKIWRSDMRGKEKTEWELIGQVQDTKAGEAGTYVPQSNKSGGGLFILNTVTGEGWWTDGKEWKTLGKPE